MNRIKSNVLVVTALTGLFFLSSCGDIFKVTDGSMTCKVDGDDWKASLAVEGNWESDILTVTGSDTKAKQVQLVIFTAGSTGTGTYELGNTMTNNNSGRWTGGVDPGLTYSTSMGMGSGSAEVTELSETGAKGTFYFTCKNSAEEEVSITEGSFDVVFE